VLRNLLRRAITDNSGSAWHVNTDLKPLDIDELKEVVANRDPSDKKFTKDLWGAYEVAAEEHDLDYFKGMLVEHEKTLIQLREEEAEKEQKKAEAADKKAKRKSTVAADAEGDVTMEDAGSEEAPKKAKKTAKRKAEKDVEVDADDKVNSFSVEYLSGRLTHITGDEDSQEAQDQGSSRASHGLSSQGKEAPKAQEGKEREGGSKAGQTSGA
jgi:hypothetical protein